MAEMSENDKQRINIAKEAYNTAKAAGDTAGMEKAHATAEAVRSKYGYSGGGDGSQNIAITEPAGTGSGGASSGRYTGSNPARARREAAASGDYGLGTYKQDLDKLTKAQRQAQVDALKAAQQKALHNLDVQEQEIKPYYQTARNNVSAASQQGARNFAEYLANRGLTNSGAAAQAEINRQSGLNNRLGNIDIAEANAYRDIANQRTALQNGLVSDLANANNAITSNYYNNLLNYNEQQRQLVEQLKQQALGQYAGDYQAYMNTLDPNSMEYLYAAAARGNKVANQYNNAMNNALSNVQNGYINYNNAAALGLTTPQAYELSNNYQAAKQAEAQAAADALNRQIAQQEFTNQINLQKLANETAKTNYTVNKPYYKPTAPKSGGNGNNEDTGFSLKDSEITKALANLSSSDREAKITDLAPYMTEDQYIKAKLGSI
jgi:hypothetical protein